MKTISTTKDICDWMYYELMDNEALAVGMKTRDQYIYFDELRSSAESLVSGMTEPELEDFIGHEDCVDIARNHLAKAEPEKLIVAICEVMGMRREYVEQEISKRFEKALRPNRG